MSTRARVGSVFLAVALAASCTPEQPANQLPVAQVTASPSGGTVPLDVAFSSAGSVDPDGTIVSYAWTFGDGATSADPDPMHTYTTGGNYLATLTVTDNVGATASATVPIAATVPGNAAPTAVAAATPASGTTPLEVVFSSAGSTDVDGTIVSYAWSFADGATSADADPVHTFTVAGSYVVTLVVTDDDGAIGTATTTVVVSDPANVLPDAVLDADATAGVSPFAVAFDTSASDDSDGVIVSRSLDFGDGTPASTAVSPSHTYVSGGVYAATLTVTDDDGAVATDVVLITVTGPTIDPSTGPAGSTIDVTVPCVPNSGTTPMAVAIAGLVSVPGGTVVTADSFDNSLTGDPTAVVTLTIPPGTAPGSYVVTSSCDLYMDSIQYGEIPFTVT